MDWRCLLHAIGWAGYPPAARIVASRASGYGRLHGHSITLVNGTNRRRQQVTFMGSAEQTASFRRQYFVVFSHTRRLPIRVEPPGRAAGIAFFSLWVFNPGFCPAPLCTGLQATFLLDVPFCAVPQGDYTHSALYARMIGEGRGAGTSNVHHVLIVVSSFSLSTSSLSRTVYLHLLSTSLGR